MSLVNKTCGLVAEHGTSLIVPSRNLTSTVHVLWVCYSCLWDFTATPVKAVMWSIKEGGPGLKKNCGEIEEGNVQHQTSEAPDLTTDLQVRAQGQELRQPLRTCSEYQSQHPARSLGDSNVPSSWRFVSLETSLNRQASVWSVLHSSYTSSNLGLLAPSWKTRIEQMIKHPAPPQLLRSWSYCLVNGPLWPSSAKLCPFGSSSWSPFFYFQTLSNKSACAFRWHSPKCFPVTNWGPRLFFRGLLRSWNMMAFWSLLFPAINPKHRAASEGTKTTPS